MLQFINFKLSYCTVCSLLLSYLFIGSLYGITEIIKDPARYNGQPVEVRGFLYQDQEGSLVLRSEPGLKSCCVSGKGPQIIIRSHDKIEPSLQARTIEGIFNIEKAGTFVLDDAKEKPGNFSHLLMIAIAFMILAIWTTWTLWTKWT